MKKAVLINKEIPYREIRLVNEDGNTVLPTFVALKRATEQGLDLVLINEAADPPICHITDGNKYKYNQLQKAKESAKKQRASHIKTKEVQFKLNISQNDFNTKCKNITKFLINGNLVKLQIQFKGRERFNTESGFDIVNRVIETIENVEVESKPQFSGNRITAILKGTKIGTTESKI